MQRSEDPVLKVVDNHVSIRRYKEDVDIPKDIFEKIIYAGIRAPSSANLQPYTIIAVFDKSLKEELSRLCGDQEHIRQCSVFLIFVADYKRLIDTMEKLGIEPFQPNIYSLYIAAVDAALAAQNITLVAESLGYGICYIGAVQNNPCKIAELLNLPRYTYPLFGLTIGIPDEKPRKRLRLDLKTILHVDRYEDSKYGEVISKYEEEGYLESLYRRLKRYLSKDGRIEYRYPKFKDCLRNRGFNT